MKSNCYCKNYFLTEGAKGSFEKSLQSTWGSASQSKLAKTNITDRMLQQQVHPGHAAHGKKFLKVKYSKPTVWLWCAGNLHKSAQAYKILFSYFRIAACVVAQRQYFALSHSHVTQHCKKAQ